MTDLMHTKLKQLCQQLGGDLEEITPIEFDRKFLGGSYRGSNGCYGAPFSGSLLGVNFPKKRILWAEDFRWCDTIHEMGHVFASKLNPEKSDEWTFFGWEYAVCLHIGGNEAEWKAASGSYSLGREFRNSDFGTLTPRRQEKLLAERLAYAKENGLVTADGVPLTIRRKRG